MALLNYKKFKVTVDGDSPKVNGLKYGDVVLRQYNDGAVSLYSIMYVIETGTTDVVINGVTKKEKWFIGALLEGDEPSSGENLDFSRITSISDEDRMGAIYMTSISSDAPYIDTIDSIGKDGSINYPNSFGDPLIYNKSSFSFIGEEYFSSSYLKYNGDEKRIFKLTKNSTPIIVGEKVAISIPTLKGKYSDEKILVTYKYRASGNFICNTEVSDSNGNYILMSKQITTSTEVKSNVDIFSVSNINDDSSFKIDLSQISVSGAWIEISDINIIPIFSLSRWYNSVKNRLGKLTGITDSVFGELKDYGGYFQRLYATKDINIAGTLTAGDANGFGSTFYAGKIHKNIFINSLSHDLGVYGKIDNSQGIPTGIGNSFILSDRSSHESHHIITYNTPEWYNSNAGKKYTFSAWIKSASGIKSVTLTENGNEPLSIQVDETWMRYSYTFAIGSDISNSYCFIDIFGADTNTGLYICGMQVELGEYASPYQPTDDTLAIENEDYGVWMTRGGIGGTIQNPLLQFTPEGDIRSKNDKFYITNDGTAYFEGSITAASGKIADWIIATNSLYRGVEKNILNSYTGAAGDITIGSNGIRGYKWRFDSDGSGALAGGKISFDADGTAKIGLWNIDENSIFSGIKQSSNDYTSSGITIHSDGAIRAKYARIDTDGKLYASSADIAGKITATLGQIGGWNINDTSITGGNTIINSNGSITNGTHWALNYDGSASFADGKIAFSSAGIGSIGGFTIGSDIIYSGESDYALGNISMQRTLDGGKFIASKDGNNYVMLYRNSDTDWGVLGALAGTNVFQLGSTNKISGWNFDSNALYTGTKALNDASNTTIANSITFWSSGAISSLNFRLGVDGKIYATNADISGKITASSGQIGAWNVDTNSIFSGTKSINDASNTTVDGSTTFWSSGAITSRYFRVGTDGKLYATSVDLQGKIVATSGSIGGWTINADSISGGSTYINSNGSITNGTLWILNADGSSSFAGGKINFTSTGEGFIGGWKINSNSIFSGTKALNDASFSTAINSMTIWSSGAISALNFRVGTDGKLYALDADISGKVTATSGKIGLWNIGNSLFTGTENNESGQFTPSVGGITIGSNGIRGYKWRFESDGSGAIAGGNIYWDAAGLLTISGNASTASQLKVAVELWGNSFNGAEPIYGPLLIKNTVDTSKSVTLSVDIDGNLKIDGNMYATGEVSAYGAGTGTGGGAVGSLGGLANVGLWADEVPTSDRIMVQLAGATHWSSKLLSEVVGLDTVALNTYLTTNNYATQSYVSTKIAELVGTAPTTLDTLNELAAALGNDPNFATSMSTLIGTKWTQDNTKIANWDSAYSALHSHTNKTELDGITSTLISNWNLAYTNNHTHPNKSIIDSLTQANLDVLAKLSIVDGNLKVDTNLWSTGEISAYGAGSGTGGGGGLISSVFGSAGLGGSYLDSDLTNTFNAYTINLINNNLTSALGRIGALETSTPNVAWGTPTAQYSPLTINSITRNLSVDGHTHNYLPLTGGTLSRYLDVDTPASSGSSFIRFLRNGVPVGYVGDGASGANTSICFHNYVSGKGISLGNDGKLRYDGFFVWHDGNDGAYSGLDADMLDGLHQASFLRCDSIDANDSKNAHYAIGTDSTHNFIQSHAGKPLHLNELGNYVYINNVLAATINSNVASATKLANTRYIWGQPFNGENDITGNLKIGYDNAFGISYSPSDTNIYNYFYGGSVFNLKVGEWTNSNVNVFNIETHNGGTAKVALSVMNNGYVGINTTGPAYELDVNGTIRGTDITGRFITPVVGTTTTLVRSDVNYAAISTDNHANTFVGVNAHIDGGYLIVNNTHPTVGYSGIVFSGNYAPYNSISFVTHEVSTGGTNTGSYGESTKMLITQLGNVLIGTRADTGYKLDVNGTGRFTGNVTAPTFIGNLNGNASSATYASSLNGFANQTISTILTSSTNGPVIKVRYDSATANRYIDFGYKDGNGDYFEGLKLYNNETMTFRGNTVWHAGNLSIGAENLFNNGGKANTYSSSWQYIYGLKDNEQITVQLWCDSGSTATVVCFRDNGYSSNGSISTTTGYGKMTYTVKPYTTNANNNGTVLLIITATNAKIKVERGNQPTDISYSWSDYLASNVASATKLANTRTIWGQNFNGEGNVSGALSGATTGTFSSSISATTGIFSNLTNNYIPRNTSFGLANSALTDDGTVSTLNGEMMWFTGLASNNKNINGIGIWGGDTGGGIYARGTSGTGTFSIENTNGRIYLNNNGRIGIGTLTPDSPLTVVGGLSLHSAAGDYGNAHIYTVGGFNSGYEGVICFAPNYYNGSSFSFVERMRITADGNVLIGTQVDTKNYRLDVNGTFRTTGAAYLNSTLSVTGASTFTGLLTANGGINATTGTFSSYVAAQRFYTGYDAGVANSFSCSNWFRSSGATGWYNGTYGGGVYMDDATYVKVYGSKSFWVNGNIVATGEVTAYSASDLRLKTEVATLKDSLRIIELLNPVSYKWNSIAKELNPLKDNNTDYGLIAQELESVMPELVHTVYGQYKSVDYIKIIPHLICAIKQLKMEIDNLKKTYY